jgi:hypothetical protein
MHLYFVRRLIITDYLNYDLNITWPLFAKVFELDLKRTVEM